MAITLETLEGDQSKDVEDVYLDVANYEEDVLILKQYGGPNDGDWVAITRPMARKLITFLSKEFS